MPTRIIREGILTSEEVNRLSDSAELFYRRLMSVADDYGRYYSNPALLRAHCYPLRVDKVSEADVKQMLSECVAAGLMVVYGAGKYVQILKFRQQTRSASKFPQPTEHELLSKCEANDKQMCSLVVVGDVVGVGVEDVQTDRDLRDGKMIRTQYVHDTSRGEEMRGEEIRKEKSTLAPLADFDRLWSAYPSKTGSKEKAKKAWEKWRRDGDTVEMALAGIERYKKSVEHQRRNGFADLKYQNGQTFFNGRGWATEWSVDDKSAQSKAETSKSEQARNRLVDAYSEQILHCATHDEAVRFMEKVHDGLRDAVAEGWVWQEWEKKAAHND